MISIKKVWTFEIRGGDPFSLRLANNPELRHTGGMTIWKLVGSEQLAQKAKGMMEELGASVRQFVEEETEEQKKERLGHMLR